MLKKLLCPSNRKVFCLNLFASFGLTVFMELMERRSFAALLLFMQERTFIFLYNVLIIFISFSIVFLVNKKYFVFGTIFVWWGMIGLINGIILSNRKTPFTAVDLTIFKSTIPILTNYFSVAEIILGLLLIILGIAGLVTLFLYSPSARKAFDLRVNVVLVGFFIILFAMATYFGVGRKLLISKFDNLIAGYQDYGSAYGFVITAIDTGIDRPIDYSRTRVKKIMKVTNKRWKEEYGEKEGTKRPNIIFLQLESYFDVTDVKDLQLSMDPLPNLHALQKQTTSGYVTVPVYGAGTINTEFEALTGMNLSYFGTGEYPYRSILHKKTCESMAYWMREEGYITSVIHNNNASFYDRDRVYCNLGFDNFISSENMNIIDYNDAGWAKDEVLKDYIMSTLNETSGRDYIYTISVQGHGDYPDKEVSNPRIQVLNEDMDKSYRNTLTYYVNQLYEMDRFVGSLIKSLSDYDEETVLVFFGDHLPGLNLEKKDLKSGSKYKTPYIIWDNYGYNAGNRKEESGNLKSYQLPSKVLAQLAIREGIMNRYHQVMQETKNYKRNMKMLQYDLLYGSSFSREGKEELKASQINYCIEDVMVKGLRKKDNSIYVMGDHFTDYSRVYVNDSPVDTSKLSDFALKIPANSIKDGDQLVVHQVSKTHQNITFNTSNTYIVNLLNVDEIP